MKTFFRQLAFLFYLDNIPEIYFDNVVEVAYEIEKIYNRVTCVCAFRKWVTCQNRLKSTELGSNATIEKIRVREKQINVMGKLQSIQNIGILQGLRETTRCLGKFTS